MQPHAQSPGTAPCDEKKNALHIVVERGQVTLFVLESRHHQLWLTAYSLKVLSMA